MKSLLLATLLALSGSFFMNGCTAEDVADALGVEASTIYFLNGNSVGVTANVEGDTKYLSTGSWNAFPYIEKDSSVSVSYSISGQTQGSKGLSNGNTHIYVSTDCNAQGYLTHRSDSSKRIQVINLRGTDIDNGDYSATLNGAAVVSAFNNAPNCKISPISISSTKGTVVVTKHSTGETWSETIDKDYSFDVVILPGDKVVIVPLVGLAEV
ncbi:MAG: hypothetical protein U9R50_09740 [Campylobacterota bacterium]|nr:hypothetical protein [Campylobacterota bacterium]